MARVLLFDKIASTFQRRQGIILCAFQCAQQRSSLHSKPRTNQQKAMSRTRDALQLGKETHQHQRCDDVISRNMRDRTIAYPVRRRRVCSAHGVGLHASCTTNLVIYRHDKNQGVLKENVQGKRRPSAAQLLCSTMSQTCLTVVVLLSMIKCSSAWTSSPATQFHPRRLFRVTCVRSSPLMQARAFFESTLPSVKTQAALLDERDPGPSDRHPIYWIDECAPHQNTQTLAVRHAKNFPKFLAHKGIAPYNREAFESTKQAYDKYCEERGERVPIILDSCCGTGRSTLNLARIRKDCFVVGIDKSLVRLLRTSGFRNPDKSPVANAALVRANCIDFWRLAWEAGWQPSEHFILYPNPYPKPKQHPLRWHGSPAFPILLSLGGRLEVRASWRTYLEEMAIAVDAVKGVGVPQVTPHVIQPAEEGVVNTCSIAMSNFERKYVTSGQPVWKMEVTLERVARESVVLEE